MGCRYWYHPAMPQELQCPHPYLSQGCTQSLPWFHPCPQMIHPPRSYLQLLLKDKAQWAPVVGTALDRNSQGRECFSS